MKLLVPSRKDGKAESPKDRKYVRLTTPGLRTFSLFRLLVLLTFGLALACSSSNNPPGKGTPKDKRSFVFKETIVTGPDTGMNSYTPFKKVSIGDVLCQRWEIEDLDDLISSPEDVDERKFPGFAFFKDSSVSENPRGKYRPGNWRVKKAGNNLVLTITFEGSKQQQYKIEDINSRQLNIATPGKAGDTFYTRLVTDAVTHKNAENDPYHPVNNRWRIKPSQSESDSAIRYRVKQCVKFYALYFRDHIKRKNEHFQVVGFPTVFKWYKRAIGLTDKDDIPQSWIDCFYNKEQAVKGYDILRNLIIDYEFEWPRRAPGWEYETHSVLEQMYHKL